MIEKISSASVPQNIEGTITEQAIKVLRVRVFVTGEIFTFPIGKKGIMPHLYPSGFYKLQPCFVQSIMSRPHAFVKAGEFSCARRVKILLQSKAAYQINEATMEHIVCKCPPPTASQQEMYAAWREAKAAAEKRLTAPPKKISFNRKQFAPYLDKLGSDRELEKLFLEFLQERLKAS